MGDSSHSNGNGPKPFPRKEVGELVGAIKRMYRALGKRFDDGFADTYSLEIIRELSDSYDDLIDQAVRALREQGYSDREIGEALGVQQPAVWKRYPR